MAIPFTYIKEPAEAEKLCKQLLTKKVVGVDYETTGLDAHKNQITLASFADDKGTYVVDTRNKNNLKIFSPLLENESIVKLAHNAPFEYTMAKGTTGVDTENLVCTLLGERCITAGIQFGGLDLATVADKYLGLTMDKELQKSFIDQMGDFSQDQLEYAAFDAHVMIPLAGKIKEKAFALGVMDTWLKTECPAIQAFGDIEFYGQKIDVAQWQAIMKSQEEKAAQAKILLDKWFEPVCSKAWNLEPGMEGSFVVDINYDSTPQVLHALKMMGIKVDGETIQNTNKKTQNKIKELEPIRALMSYRQAQKATGTYGQSYLDAIHPGTGRVHFRFNQYGTDTGRVACRGGLNCLNIPRDKRYRSAFVTDQDRWIDTVDYAAAELRILAELSGDRLMIDGFNSGIDFHCYVASMIFGVEVTKSNENKHLREPTKQLNFGIAYGMSPFSLYEKLVYEIGHKITLKECEELFAKYERTFRTAIHWLKSQQRLASSVYQMSNMNGRLRRWTRPNFAKIREKAEAEVNRKYRNQPAEDTEQEIAQLVEQKTKAQKAAVQREGANCQIQSVNADFCKRAMARTRKEFKRLNYDSRMYNSVYDEIVTDSHDSCAKEAHALKKKIMIEEADKMLKLVPMQVEGHLERCWTK
jgi:DNA polymerase-1